MDIFQNIPQEQQTFEICSKAVKDDIQNINHIRPDLLRTEELDIIIVQNHSWALDYFKPSSYRVYFEAIRKNAMQLYLIDEDIQDKDMVFEAVTQNREAMPYVAVKHRSLELCLYFLNRYKYGLRFFPREMVTEEICWTAIRHNPREILKIPDRLITEDIHMYVLEKENDIIHFIKNKFWTEKMVWRVINSGGNCNSLLTNPDIITEDMWRAMASHNAFPLYKIPQEFRDRALLQDVMNSKSHIRILKHFKHLDLTELEILEIIKLRPMEIAGIDNQTEEMQFEAIKRCPALTHYVENFNLINQPSNDIILYAINRYHRAFLLEKLDKNYIRSTVLLEMAKHSNILEHLTEDYITEDICVESFKYLSPYSTDKEDIDRIPLRCQTERVWTEIVKIDGRLIRYCRKQTTELVEIAVRQNYHSLSGIREIFKNTKLLKLAIDNDYEALRYAGKHKTQELCQYAFVKNVHAIGFFKKEWVTDELRQIAFEKDPTVMLYFKDQYVTDEMIQIVMDKYGTRGPTYVPNKQRITYDMYVDMVKKYIDRIESSELSNGGLYWLLCSIKDDNIRARIKGHILSGKFKKSLGWLYRVGLKNFKWN